MKIKNGIEVSTSEFWYDVTNGYLKPEEILEDTDDIERVYQAIAVITDFEESCEEQIEGFVQ